MRSIAFGFLALPGVSHENDQRSGSIPRLPSRSNMEETAIRTLPAEAGREMQKSIRIRGARQHNLRNLDLRLPRDRWTVITGVSGSGKSSLALDTLYAEGYRKYMEGLSTRARQVLDQLERPEVDFIEGLSPVIAVEQHSARGANPRSTVASLTEIADYARVLWAAAGQPHCPLDG